MPSSLSQNVAAVAMSVVLLVIVVGVILLEMNGNGQPDLLQVIAGAAVGALANELRPRS